MPGAKYLKPLGNIAPAGEPKLSMGGGSIKIQAKVRGGPQLSLLSGGTLANLTR